jgi:glycosyltransferase involved in cell wall biosynthesis
MRGENGSAPIPVLLLSPSGVAGGAERAFLGLARCLPALGIRPVAVLLQPGPLEDWLLDAGCETHVLATHRTRHVHRTARTVYALHGLVRRTQVRAVVSNNWKGHLFGGMAALAAGVPEIFWQHAVPAPNLLDRIVNAVPTRMIACCSDAALQAQRAFTSSRKTCRIYPGIRIADVMSGRGRGAVIRQSLGWSRNPIVGIIGRLEPGKGQAVFLQAAARVVEAAPEARFAVVGGALLGSEGSYPEDLRRLAVELGIADRVHFAGHQADVYPWYDALDVAVNASHIESFGLVLLEAMALGKPLVATAVQGPVEIVEDGVSGLLVPPGDPGRLAEAVWRILGDQGLASSLGHAAAERAKVFSEECMAERFAELLRRVIAPATSESGSRQ